VKKAKHTVGACALGALFALGGVSAELPEPPATSDIALRILPTGGTPVLDPEEMAEHPVVRVITRTGAELFGLEPLRFLDDTFEGTVVAAVLSKASKGGTGLADFFHDQELRDRWESNVKELRSLADDLKYEFDGSDKPYPDDLQPYFEEVRYYEPYLSAGVSYRYERLNEGKDFRLTMLLPAGSKMSKLGAAPVFSSEEGYLNETPTARPLPMNVVLAAKIRSKEQLVSVLTKTMGEPQGGFWRAKGEMPFFVTIRNEWVVGADQMENLGGMLRSLNGQAPGWSATPGFQKVARNINTEAPVLFYLNTPSLVQAMAAGGMTETEQRLASLVGPLGYAILPYSESQFRLEVFLGLEAPENSKLQSFLEGSRGQSPEAGITTSNVPWDVSNMVAMDYGNTKALLDSVVALFPDAEAQIDMGEDVFMGMFGLDAESGLDRLIEGNAILSFERVDFFATAFESALDMATQVASEPYAEKDTDTDTEAETETVESEAAPVEEEVVRKPSPLAYLPATVAVQIPLETNRKGVTAMLEAFQGTPEVRNLHGVDVIHSEDGDFAYAFDQDWLYLSGGKTSRLMKRMLETAHGRRENLESIDSWSRFKLGGRGRLLMFGHQKVDAVYSMVKGFLLFLGSDFRPLATELGELRDYHALGTVVPDGILVVGEVLKGDQR